MHLHRGGCSSSYLRTVCRSLRPAVRPAVGLCLLAIFLVILMPLSSCGNSGFSSQPKQDPSASSFSIESAAFSEGESIPSRFTCKGQDISPALSWTAPPSGTHSFVLIVEDPDAPAGIWTHWVVYNLPAGTRAMPENVPKQDHVPGGGLQGMNSFGNTGYGGPCPPPGNAHRYFFRLYALDTMLSLKSGASKEELLAAAKGHILDEAHLMGRFKR